MHCTISCTELLRILSSIQKIPTKHPTLPILAYTVLEVVNDSLHIRCTNLSLGVKWSLSARTTTDGTCAIDTSILLSAFASETGDIDIILEGATCMCTCGGSVVQLKTLPVEDMPTLPNTDRSLWCSIDTNDFVAVVQPVVFAAATSDLRPEISAVFIATRQSLLIAAATDSFKLAEVRVPAVYEQETNVLVPARYIPDIVRICNTVSGTVQIYTSDSLLYIENESMQLVIRTISGAYPDYEQIIPKQSLITAECTKDELKNALRVVLPFTEQSFAKVDMQFSEDDGLVTFETGMHDQGAAKSTFRSLIRGAMDTVRINAKILSDIIAVIPDSELILSATEPNRPIMIRGAKSESMRCLIMPLHR